MIKENREKCKVLFKKLINSTVALTIILAYAPPSYADSEEEDKGASVKVYPKSFDATKGGIRNLVVPQDLGVEYLNVNLSKRKLTVVQANKESQDLKSGNRPLNFPWQLASEPEKMEKFLNSQSLRLTLLDKGEYDLKMHTTGNGGYIPVSEGGSSSTPRYSAPIDNLAAKMMQRDGYSEAQIRQSQARYEKAMSKSGKVVKDFAEGETVSYIAKKIARITLNPIVRKAVEKADKIGTRLVEGQKKRVIERAALGASAAGFIAGIAWEIFTNPMEVHAPGPSESQKKKLSKTPVKNDQAKKIQNNKPKTKTTPSKKAPVKKPAQAKAPVKKAAPKLTKEQNWAMKAGKGPLNAKAARIAYTNKHPSERTLQEILRDGPMVRRF